MNKVVISIISWWVDNISRYYYLIAIRTPDCIVIPAISELTDDDGGEGVVQVFASCLKALLQYFYYNICWIGRSIVALLVFMMCR